MRVYQSWGGQKHHHATADSAKVECDDDGFHLIVETDEGDRVDIKIHGVAEELLESAKETIGGSINERESARGAWPAPVTEGDLDGYALGDPKRVELERQIH